jgi:hypothetical protein
VPEVILNRDLKPSDVPLTRTHDLAEPGSGHDAEWARVWRFALTFDPDAYAEATGTELDTAALIERFRTEVANQGSITAEFAALRAVLHALFLETYQGASVGGGTPGLIDALLDAIYADVSGGKDRPPPDPPVFEDGLGVFGANHGDGQHRFWFTPRDELDREALFDRVAGILLRAADEAVIVSALYLYPPTYPVDDGAPSHAFMLLLEPRDRERGRETVESEYERLPRLVVRLLADPSADHHPPLEPDRGLFGFG